MKKSVLAVVLFFLVNGFAGVGHANLDDFLRRIDAQAKADLGLFSVHLSAQFGVPVPKIDAIIKQVAAPADAFMVLQLGRMAGKQPETVVQTYTSNKGKGWGEIARQLGIKPGSAEFHALKRGDFQLTGQPAGTSDPGPGKGKGRGKGHK